MKKGLALFEGSWQKVLIKVAILLLMLYAAYRLYKYLTIKPSKTKTEVDEYITTELPNTIPVDNSTPNDPDTITENEANLIANNLQNYMSGAGTETGSLMSTLECLNGASLNKVYAAFGSRVYPAVYWWEDDSDRDLFGWFAADLSDATFVTQVYWSECVDGCNSYWDLCKELTYMRNIWQRSSIPITF